MKDGDNWSVAVLQKGKSPDGKYDWRSKYFFPKIYFIMDWLVENRLMQGDYQTFKDIDRKVDELKATLTKQIQELNK